MYGPKDMTVYSYNRIAAPEMTPFPTYKGRSDVFTHVGMDVWALEGRGVRIILEGSGARGWKARAEFEDEAALRGGQRPWTYGRDAETVIDTVLKDELTRVKGAKTRLDEKERALRSLG